MAGLVLPSGDSFQNRDNGFPGRRTVLARLLMWLSFEVVAMSFALDRDPASSAWASWCIASTSVASRWLKRPDLN